MPHIKTRDKWDACHAFINVWLRDNTLYCNHCGSDYIPGVPACCENPQIGKNIDHAMGLIKQNKELQKTRMRGTGSNETQTMRWGVSIPPRLYTALNNYFRQTINEKLFENQKQLRQFMRRFKQFCIPERI